MDWGPEPGPDRNPFYVVSICRLVYKCIDLIFTPQLRRWLNKKFDSIWTVNAHGRELRLRKSREPD